MSSEPKIKKPLLQRLQTVQLDRRPGMAHHAQPAVSHGKVRANVKHKKLAIKSTVIQVRL